MAENTTTTNTTGLSQGNVMTLSQVLTEGIRGEDVEKLQHALHHLGFYTGRIDGIFGPLTRDAVTRLQRNNSMEPTGVVDEALSNIINHMAEAHAAKAPSLKIGSKGDAVRGLQGKLQSLGYYHGAIDGDFGLLTQQAVISFQKDSGLDPDGIVGPLTSQALTEALAKGKKAPDHAKDRLGALSAKYESNGDPGIISNMPGDPGGKSYGAWQLASKRGSLDSFLTWLSGKSHGDYTILMSAKNKDGGRYGSFFDGAWKSLANKNREVFLDLQRDYIKNAYYDKAALQLKKESGFDISTKSLALKNVLWSTAVQHGAGGAVNIFKKTGLLGSDRDLINGVYDERSKVDIYFRGASPQIRKAVADRFSHERKDALKMLDTIH